MSIVRFTTRMLAAAGRSLAAALSLPTPTTPYDPSGFAPQPRIQYPNHGRR